MDDQMKSELNTIMRSGAGGPFAGMLLNNYVEIKMKVFTPGANRELVSGMLNDFDEDLFKALVELAMKQRLLLGEMTR
jgi:hypothetical protein